MKKRLFVLFLFIVSFISIKNVYAETYDGEYSVEYLLKNYSVVTLGQNNTTNNWYYGNIIKKGDFYTERYSGIEVNGSVLISGNLGDLSDYNNNYNNITIDSGSSTIKSYIKGNINSNNSIPANTITDPNYIDFNKMYKEILKQSKTIADNTEYYINSPNFEVSKPGIYTVQNTASVISNNNYDESNFLFIKDYDKNNIYVFNYYNEYIHSNSMPKIILMEPNASNAVYLSEYINSGKYNGNIIFNFPNAKFIEINEIDTFFGLYYRNESEILNANIIAPNADILIETRVENYYGNIIANSICTSNNINGTNYKLDKKIGPSETYSYIEQPKNYTDDYYTRDYSIKDLLQNYSLITLGHKRINSKAKLSRLTNKNGSVRLFHITGQALINGDMVYDKDGFISAFDLESNKATESYINGRGSIGNYNDNNTGGYTVIQPWDNMGYDNMNYLYQKNNLLIAGGAKYPMLTNAQGIYTANISDYIDFNRLYENVIAEQKGIAEGKTLTAGSDGILHIPTGGTYNISDISNVKEIVFDNFEKNKDELTIITIKNEGDINFPLISKDGNGYKGIVTNDYFGKENATHLYELDTFLSEDSYYGNIVWNLPNADYIKLKENAPFAGHMIAPNADVETPELHFAGCFIVNSIYGEGNTEAHFYPINTTLKCEGNSYDGLSETQKKKFNEYRLSKELGGNNTIIEKEIIGDKDQYNKDMSLFEELDKKCENRIIVINPETFSTIGIILGLLVLGSIVYITLKSRKKGITKE